MDTSLVSTKLFMDHDVSSKSWRNIYISYLKGNEIRQVFFASLMFLLTILTFFYGVWWINENIPYIKPGSDVVYAAKTSYLEQNLIFAPNKPIKVLVFGNSKVLSGFIPDQFDHELHNVTSYNVGLPNEEIFLPLLKKIIANGSIPTHVLYTGSWLDPEINHLSFFNFIPSDEKIMNQLFSFRSVLRNAVVFLLRSNDYGGPRAFYNLTKVKVKKMLYERGYHFIEEQSRFPEHRLPDNFSLSSDNSARVGHRDTKIDSAAFQEIKRMAKQYGFKVVAIPNYFRQGEYGVSGINHDMIKDLAPYHAFRVLGDDYVLFSNHYFSDIDHLNVDGAKIYTHMLAQLFSEHLVTNGDRRAV